MFNNFNYKKMARLVLTGTLALVLTLTSAGIASADRGKCTDSHSKEWCDANGYENNRPVQHMVKLTEKQKQCFWNAVAQGLIITSDCIITHNYIAVPASVMSIISTCS